MYQVFDNDKPAVYPGTKWNNNVFYTFNQARRYCEAWLGEYRAFCPLESNHKVDYSGYGDYIEIRKVVV